VSVPTLYSIPTSKNPKRSATFDNRNTADPTRTEAASIIIPYRAMGLPKRVVFVVEMHST